MVQYSRDLSEQGADKLGALRNLNVQQLLDTQREALLVGHHGDVIEPVEVGQGLQVGLVLDQLLGATMEQADVRVGANDLLALQLKDQAQHAVGGRMLGAEVDGVVADFPVLDALVAGLLGGPGLGARPVDAVGVGRVGEVGVDGHEGGALDGGDLVRLPAGRLGKGADSGGSRGSDILQAPGAAASHAI